MTRIVVDAMGGDNAPLVNVLGALESVKEAENIKIVLVGREKSIKECFDKYGASSKNIEIVDAAQVIETDEKPADAFRKKKESSIAVGITLLKNKEVDAFVSAGNTGAVVAFSIFTLGRMKSVLRPALATFFPTAKGNILALDVGATSDSKAINLLQFGIMGSIYFEKITGKEKPSVGLLSIGEESTKGKDLTYQVFSLLKKSHLNFIGNIEGNDILQGKADVVVTDGFVGNVILKFGESLIKIVGRTIKESLKRNFRYKIGGMLLLPALKSFFDKMSYEEYGGAALLGVNGVIIVSHGRSKPKAVKNAILTARKNVEENVNEIISEKLKETNIGV